MAPVDAANCSVYYSIQYRIDDHDYVTINTVNLFYDLHRLLPCTYIHVKVWSVSEHSGEKSAYFAVGQYAGKLEIILLYSLKIPSLIVLEIPQVISPPKLRGAPVEDGRGFMIIWEKPKKLIKCRLEYKLQIKTDFRKRMYTYLLSSTSFLVVNRFYCFVINTKIATRYNSIQGRHRSKRFIHSKWFWQYYIRCISIYVE